MFNGYVHYELRDLANNHLYDYAVLCSPDIPFDQDGTRKDEAFRMEGHQFYLNALEGIKQPFIEVSGTVQERVAQVRKYVGL